MDVAELPIEVGQLAKRVRKVTAERDAAIRAAVASGNSYRKIAEATELSPAGIGRIVKRGS